MGEIVETASNILKLNVDLIEKNKNNFNFRNTDNTFIKKILKWKPKKNLKNSASEIIASLKKINLN